MSACFRRALRTATALAALLWWSVLPARAQNAQTRHDTIALGVKGGPLFSSLRSDVSTDEFENKTAFVGGLFVDANRPGLFGAAIELLYARKGANDANSSEGVTIDYFEVPVLLRINPRPSSPNGVDVYGVVGPAFDIRLRSKLTTGESLTDEIARADIGLVVGLGVDMSRFLIEARYTRGLRDIGTADLDLGGALKSQTAAIFFGVRFR